MTREQTERIAIGAIAVHDQTKALRLSEERGQRLQARDDRRALAAAQAELDKAIEEAVEQ